MSNVDKIFRNGTPLDADDLNKMVEAINDNDHKLGAVGNATTPAELASVVARQNRFSFTGNLANLRKEGKYYLHYSLVGPVTDLPEDIDSQDIIAVVSVDLYYLESKKTYMATQFLVNMRDGNSYTRCNGAAENNSIEWTPWKKLT